MRARSSPPGAGPACGRAFQWRCQWKKVWEEVRYCFERRRRRSCRRWNRLKWEQSRCIACSGSDGGLGIC
ncbi:DUF2256 domain-containing protein [Synechococcus sp. UW140]|uniref:DUF2256 domain-containing protein n=1 Tax=Synechococcus sp. UW140 TaxID=368503 RepID=UPI000E0ECAEC|nr:DUF2256 domain-containing protein [Synechococcus sp. UW140]